MSTLLPATQQRVDTIMQAAGYPPDPISDGGRRLRATIVLALKEQVRDARHACAEAVQSAPRHSTSDAGDPLISIHDAHQLCMNTHTV